MSLSSGSVAIVTGAAMGMGRALAIRLRRQGCALALCDVDTKGLESLKTHLQQIYAGDGGESRLVTIHTVDVGNREDVARFAVEVEAAHGGIVHALFNNAGIIRSQAWDRMPEEQFDKVMAVNLDGVVSCTRKFWPLLMRAAPAKAFIVNTSSVAGFFPPAASQSTPYAVSKYAVRGFSEHLAWQCQVIAPHMQVVSVHPGAVNTEIPHTFFADTADMRFLGRSMGKAELGSLQAMSEEEKLEWAKEKFTSLFEKWGHTSEQAADMIVDGVLAGKTKLMVGWDAVIMDWWIRLFPRIFMYRAGTIVVMLSSVVGRHFVWPSAVLGAVGGAAYFMLKHRSRL